MPFWSHTSTRYSGFAKLLHWLTALGVFGLFALGVWMVTLDYYHAWYQTGPEWHISIGVLLAFVVVVRIAYRLVAGVPGAVTGQARWQQVLAHLVHVGLYLLLIAVFVSGYLIVTAEGDAVPVFQWFKLPAFRWPGSLSTNAAGQIHQICAYALLALAGVHALAALKHQFWDRDGTLMRMIRTSDSPAAGPDSSQNKG